MTGYQSLEEKKAVVRAALLGQAVGDAFGVPYEFMSRAEVQKLTLCNMEGCDTNPGFKSRWSELIPAGAWSDDTSMTIAAMDSIIRSCGEIDYEDHMKSFNNWWKGGQYCALDFPFGLGGVISQALKMYSMGAPAILCGGRGFRDNGNGSLMRIFPSSLLCIFSGYELERTIEVIGYSSAITHAHQISQIGCLIFTEFLRALLDGKSIEEALQTIQMIDYWQYYQEEAVDAFEQILLPTFSFMGEEVISESGYVVDTLKTALYALLHTDSYEEAVCAAVRMGYDTDTAAAVTGVLAGVYYGADAIPQRWLDALRKKEMLEEIADKFAEAVDSAT